MNEEDFVVKPIMGDVRSVDEAMKLIYGGRDIPHIGSLAELNTIKGGIVTLQDVFNQFDLLAQFMGENNLNQEKVLEILKWHLNK